MVTPFICRQGTAYMRQITGELSLLWEKIIPPYRIQPVEHYYSAVSHCLDMQQASSYQHGAPILRTGL